MSMFEYLHRNGIDLTVSQVNTLRCRSRDFVGYGTRAGKKYPVVQFRRRAYVVQPDGTLDVAWEISDIYREKAA